MVRLVWSQLAELQQGKALGLDLKPSMSKCLLASCSVELIETLMWINRNEDANMDSDCHRGCFGDCTAGTGLKLQQDFTRVWFCLFLV